MYKIKKKQPNPKKPKNQSKKKPHITWVEGMLSLFDSPFPHDKDDPRGVGFSVAKQVLGLYIIELLLKYALDDCGTDHGHGHNLHALFKLLPPGKQSAVDRKYIELLHSEVKSTWDIERSVDAFLDYLGENPITDTRYFWEKGRSHVVGHASIIIMPSSIRRLLFAMFIVLHKYPSKPITKRYDTTFTSLKESLEKDAQPSSTSKRAQR